jgi:methylated-DNA-[protein]-cysteine S-methyltransferase
MSMNRDHLDSDTHAISTPIGRLTLVGSAQGLQEILWGGAAGEHPAGSAAVLLAEAERQLDDYFAGRRRQFELPLDLRGTPFQLEAWRALAELAYGSTVSYAEQAHRLGRPAASRAVGAANARNPVPIVLPCHRIVGADGSLTGFGGGLWRKRALLEHEAAVIAASPSD